MSAGYLIVNPDGQDSYTVDLEPWQVLPIGRKPASDASRKLILAVPEVSAQHAEIRHSSQGWTVRDSGSTNGTRLNGTWLIPGREYALHNGDKLTIAVIDLTVSLIETTQEIEASKAIGRESDSTQLHIHILLATIMVADIRSFTGLLEKYASQPELVMQATRKVFQSIEDIIVAHGGQLEKIAGDAIMAYWHGDNTNFANYAFKACTTALSVRSQALTLAQDKNIWPFEDFPLHLDMALATGPVAAGALAKKENNPALLGDTANLAFRLEKLIPENKPGSIVVETTTYELTKENFAFTSLGEFAVKGRQRPVDVYQLLHAQLSETT